MFAVEVANRIDGVKNVRCCAVERGFGQRGNKARMLGACERYHRVTMHERSERRLRLVRRPRGRDEVNRVEMKTLLRRLRHRDMPRMHGIKRAAKKRHLAPVLVSVRPVRVRRVRGQRSSGWGATA